MASEVTIAVVTQIGAFLVAALSTGAAIYMFEKQRREKNIKNTINEDDTISNRIRKDIVLKDICEDIRTSIRADRVNIWLAHNGGHYLNGEGMKKLSMIVESLGDDQVPALRDMQNVPVQIFLRNLVRLIDPANTYIFEVDESRYNDALKFFNEKYSVMSSAIFKIKDKQNNFIGCLGIGYSKYTQIESSSVDYVMSQLPIISDILIPAWYEQKRHIS